MHLKPPRQDRSRRTLERIVTAALEILRDEGPDALTVQGVVARSRSSVGSFYARFDGKDDLLDYLGERVWTEALERWNREMETRDWSALALEELVSGAVSLLVEVRRGRVAALRSIDDASKRRRGDAHAAFTEQLVESLSGLLLAHAPRMTHPNPAFAVRFALHSVLGGIDAVGGAPADQEGPEASGAPDEDEPAGAAGKVVDEGRALVLAYLVGVTGSAPEHDVDFFDVWG